MTRSFKVPVGLLASASDPTETASGAMYYNTVTNRVRVYDGFAWTNAGVQGTQGLAIQGANGTQGLVGSQGANGTQGTQGANGAQGTNGTQGTVGSQGTVGTQGTQGTLGTQGISGSQGTLGTQGLIGQVSAEPTVTVLLFGGM